MKTLVNPIDPGVVLTRNALAFSTTAHLTHMDMFRDTLNMTASPALALQVLLARVCQMAYYEQLVKMNTKTTASTAFSYVSSIPVQWTGFVIGSALIAAHDTVVGIVTIKFLECTTGSLIGNYWQAVSQMVSKKSRPILELADRMSDAEVKHWAKHQSLDLKSRCMLRCQDDGRIALGAMDDER